MPAIIFIFDRITRFYFPELFPNNVIFQTMKKTLAIPLLFLLALACGTYAQNLDYPQRTFLRENAYTIYPDEAFSRSSWDYIVPHITDKRIVMIGEFTHGAKEILQLHNALIRFLHDKLGYNAILFEAGIGELAAIDLNRKQLNAAQMTAGFYKNGRTKGSAELMEYIKASNIFIAGYDVQQSGNSFITILKKAARKQNIDTAFCINLEKRFDTLDRQFANRNAAYESLSQKTTQLIAGYQQTYDRLSVNKEGNFGKDHLFSLKTIANRIRFLQYKLRFTKDKDWHRAWAARDSAMADNIRWLADSVFKNEKLIVIGHNFHVAKSNEQEKVMGEIVRTHFPNDTYSFGLFAAGGSYADNYGKEMKMMAPDSAHLDIKHVIARLGGFVSYLHIPENKVTGTEWLHQYTVVNDTFIELGGSNKMILAKQFDGLLMLKKVSPVSP